MMRLVEKYNLLTRFTNFNPKSAYHKCSNVLETFSTNSVDPDQTAPEGAV